jgi:hypothetical protein
MQWNVVLATKMAGRTYARDELRIDSKQYWCGPSGATYWRRIAALLRNPFINFPQPCGNVRPRIRPDGVDKHWGNADFP